MNGFKKTIRNFFGTTRAQTNGFVGLLFVITIAIFSQPLTRWWVSTQPQDFSKDAAQLDSLTQHWKTSEEEKSEPTEERTINYFNFDPNTASQEELMSLGFTEKLASRIINYRSKGGKFRIKSDLMKLYGMDSALYINVSTYVQLPDQVEKREFEKKEFADRPKFIREKPQKFNLNEADTIQLEKIYGIGPALAKRIVKYRDKLGGFVSQNQLMEVYGLDTAVVKKIGEATYLPDLPGVKKINLNTADEKTLAAHPYFDARLPAPLSPTGFSMEISKSVDDLSKIPLIDKNNLGKLFPYATVDP